MDTEVLNTLSQGDLTPQEAYEKLYPVEPEIKKLKKARYVRMKITLLEESAGLNTFLKLLFIFPIPVWLIKMSVGLGNRVAKLEEKLDDNIDLKMLKTMINHASGTKVHIISDDAIIRIDIS